LASTGKKKDDKFFQVADNVLKQVVGQEATLLIYKHLENHYSLYPEDYSKRMDLFAKGLKDCLSTAAFPIENMILCDLYGLKISKGH
jgi:hypothetical protein